MPLHLFFVTFHNLSLEIIDRKMYIVFGGFSFTVCRFRHPHGFVGLDSFGRFGYTIFEERRGLRIYCGGVASFWKPFWPCGNPGLAGISGPIGNSVL